MHYSQATALVATAFLGKTLAQVDASCLANSDAIILVENFTPEVESFCQDALDEVSFSSPVDGVDEPTVLKACQCILGDSFPTPKGAIRRDAEPKQQAKKQVKHKKAKKPAKKQVKHKKAKKPAKKVKAPTCNKSYVAKIKKAKKHPIKFCKGYKPKAKVHKSPIKGIPSAQAVVKACQCILHPKKGSNVGPVGGDFGSGVGAGAGAGAGAGSGSGSGAGVTLTATATATETQTGDITYTTEVVFPLSTTVVSGSVVTVPATTILETITGPAPKITVTNGATGGADATATGAGSGSGGVNGATGIAGTNVGFAFPTVSYPTSLATSSIPSSISQSTSSLDAIATSFSSIEAAFSSDLAFLSTAFQNGGTTGLNSAAIQQLQTATASLALEATSLFSAGEALVTGILAAIPGASGIPGNLAIPTISGLPAITLPSVTLPTGLPTTLPTTLPTGLPTTLTDALTGVTNPLTGVTLPTVTATDLGITSDLSGILGATGVTLPASLPTTGNGVGVGIAGITVTIYTSNTPAITIAV